MPIASSYTPLILAGGLGTRLSPIVPDVPKPLARIAGRPFIAFLLDQLVETGFRDAVISIGDRAEVIERALGNVYRGLGIKYVREETLLGTAGAIRLAAPTIATPNCLVLNGDSYCAVDLNAFMQWHHGRSESVALVLANVPDRGRYGGVELADGDRILSFREKEARAGFSWISAGIYSIPLSLIQEIPMGRPVSLEKEVFPDWAALGMAGYCSKGVFIDIGTPDSYRASEQFFRDLRASVS